MATKMMYGRIGITVANLAQRGKGLLLARRLVIG
jgi:hypothetical protein